MVRSAKNSWKVEIKFVISILSTIYVSYCKIKRKLTEQYKGCNIFITEKKNEKQHISTT